MKPTREMVQLSTRPKASGAVTGLLHNCEWCERKATFCLVCRGGYLRFACQTQGHRQKLRQLVTLDGREIIAVQTAAHGFALAEAR